MALTEREAPERNRGGRPRKADKRISLSTRLEPELLSDVRAFAEEDGQVLAREAALLIQDGINARRGTLPASAEKPYDRPAPPSLSIKGRRRPVDVFARDFGREAFGLSLLSSCLLREILYSDEYRNIEGAWLTNPEIVRRIAGLTEVLLRFVGPDEDPALAARIRQSFFIGRTDPLHPVAQVAMELAFDESEPWAPIIRDLLGEAVVARMRQKLGDDPAEALREHG